ncbi:MAG: excinuclease ABC subunit UvrC [Verrucomicrobia bacterium]|nr:excinuclease ABC subunit UvrC [Verrucomicrobiota bacterium]MBV9673975.1 excinuclease ABC subunit UvrC [Verrucomicrobiota bacterium]
MRDRLNRVIYVGKARDLRKRLSQYFVPSRRMTADLKTRALLDGVWDFEIHVVRSEPEAVLLEGKLIKEYRPRYNISFRDDKRFLLVKVNLADPIPRFQLTRLKKDDGCRYFGPFAHAGALRSTLNWMRKRFGIRACRAPEPGESDYRRCLDHIIKNCSAPCIRRVSLEEYHSRVLQACEFLEGQSHEMLRHLETEMKKAAERLDFEKAAELRDMLDDLRRTTKPVRKFVRGSLPSSIDPRADLHNLADALLLPKVPFVMECFDISNISTTHIVASMVSFRNGVPDKSNYRRYRVRTVAGQDDFASMAEVVRRRYSRVLLEARQFAPELSEFNQENVIEAVHRVEVSQPERFVRLPDLIIVDGGKGQLGAACRELERLGLHDIPIIGLAKEFEEIYRPGRPLPLRLPDDSGALHLLQRIRDEAHRFANSYHQLLMKKRVAESVLDDCPGISENRRQILLSQFGSVERLRRASIGEIAALDGISEKLAETIVRFLHRSTGEQGSAAIGSS